MSILTLPDTTEVIAEYPYFPTRQQLFIWRNWGMVKTETIAEVLGTDVMCKSSQLVYNYLLIYKRCLT